MIQWYKYRCSYIFLYIYEETYLFPNKSAVLKSVPYVLYVSLQASSPRKQTPPHPLPSPRSSPACTTPRPITHNTHPSPVPYYLHLHLRLHLCHVSIHPPSVTLPSPMPRQHLSFNLSSSFSHSWYWWGTEARLGLFWLVHIRVADRHVGVLFIRRYVWAILCVHGWRWF